jgi:hypothetical protein
VYIQPIHITPKDPCIGTRTVFWRLFGSVMAYEHDSKKYSDRDIEVVLFIRVMIAGYLLVGNLSIFIMQ